MAARSGAGGVGVGDLLDDLAKGGLRAPATTPGKQPTEADFHALLNSPLGRAVLGGVAAFGMQEMEEEKRPGLGDTRRCGPGSLPHSRR